MSPSISFSDLMHDHTTTTTATTNTYQTDNDDDDDSDKPSEVKEEKKKKIFKYIECFLLYSCRLTSTQRNKYTCLHMHRCMKKIVGY